MAHTNLFKFAAGLTLALAGCGGEEESRVHYLCECGGSASDRAYIPPQTSVCLQPDESHVGTASEIAREFTCDPIRKPYYDYDACDCTCEEAGTCSSDDPEAWTEPL